MFGRHVKDLFKSELSIDPSKHFGIIFQFSRFTQLIKDKQNIEIDILPQRRFQKWC